MTDIAAQASSDGRFSARVGRTAPSGLWMVLSSAAQSVIGIASTAILARTLEIDAFGLFAMAVAPFAVAVALRDLGIPHAIVQQRRVDDGLLTSVFWMNARWAVAVALSMSCLAVPLSWLFEQTLLLALVPTVAGSVMLLSLSNVHSALLRRTMRFRSIAAVDVTAALMSASLAVFAAIELAFGVWALLVQYAANNVLIALGRFVAFRWLPARSADAAPAQFRRIRRFSVAIVGHGLLTNLSRNLDKFLLGAMFVPETLGLYQKSSHYATLAAQQAAQPTLPVAVSTLSAMADDPPEYRRGFRQIAGTLAAFGFGASAWVALCATELILLLLSRDWLEAVPYLRILSVASACSLVPLILKWAFLSAGTGRALIKHALFAGPVLMLCVAVGAVWGALGIAVGFAIGSALAAIPAVVLSVRHTPLRASDIARTFLPAALLAVLGCGAAAFGRSVFGWEADVLTDPVETPYVSCAIQAVSCGIVCGLPPFIMAFTILGPIMRSLRDPPPNTQLPTEEMPK